MKMVATSYVTQKKTTHSLESLGSENKVPFDPLGTRILVPVPPIVEKPMVVQTTNLGGEIGSADAPMPTEFSPLKKAPPIVVTNKPVDPQPSFCPIQTYEDMTRAGIVDSDIQRKPPSFHPLSTIGDIQRQTTVDLGIQQKRIETVLKTVKPGKNGSNLVLDAVAKMVSLLFIFKTLFNTHCTNIIQNNIINSKLSELKIRYNVQENPVRLNSGWEVYLMGV